MKPFRWFLLAPALMLAAPALAQTPDRAEAEQLRRVANRSAMRVVSCALKQSPTSARKLVETEMGSKAEAKQARAIQAFSRGCAGDLPALTPFILRNAAAIMVYDQEFSRQPPPLPATPPAPPATFAVVPADRQGDEVQENIWYVASIANCVAFADPALAREAVVSDRDPASEEKAFGALKPVLAKCLPAGAEFPITPLEFRGILAEQLLHRSRALKAGR